jgi:hypothetical protein
MLILLKSLVEFAAVVLKFCFFVAIDFAKSQLVLFPIFWLCGWRWTMVRDDRGAFDVQPSDGTLAYCFLSVVVTLIVLTINFEKRAKPVSDRRHRPASI